MTSAPAPSLLSWFRTALGQPQGVFHIKLRGNILHVLCETPEPLDQATVVLKLVRSLLDSQHQYPLRRLYPHIYQLYLYSRAGNATAPQWTAPLYLNRLERHLAQLVLDNQDDEDLKASQLLLEDYAHSHGDLANLGSDSSQAIVLSNLSLARRGDLEAIAWYLSETLSALDVGVWVSIKAIPGMARLPRSMTTDTQLPDPWLQGRFLPDRPGNQTAIPRLWILCEATYSPDPALIARPTAERLRLLGLTQFKDAVLLLQVRGESKPDWSLRIDLTPAEEMLREWGRWGDVDALAKLLNLHLESYGISLSLALRDATLHSICILPAQPPGDRHPELSATQANLVTSLATLLEDLAPQGIHRAVIYGQPQDDSQPDWVHYLDLPAASHAALADPPEYLAQIGDLPALAFLLTRQLNPNLEDRLATGGMRVQLLIRDRLLHIMVDSPLVPQRRLIAPLIRNYLQSLSPVDIEGVRIYGRRSGQSQPIWSYGRNFFARDRLVPEAAPEFTAAHGYVNDLLVRPEEAISSHQEPVGPHQLGRGLGQWLLRTQLFVSSSAPPPLTGLGRGNSGEGIKIALVWAAVGVLAAFQMDWLIGQLLTPTTALARAETVAASPRTKVDQSTLTAFSSRPSPTPFTQLKGFIDNPEGQSEPKQRSAVPPNSSTTAKGMPASPSFASFNSQQLNEKLTLYRQRLAQSGPADVMIVGSSRALRGVDPANLQKQLADLGYSSVNIFNFGINGATAQVVDLVIRQILEPDQLPKLILWADGARAFNSGREDVTYNAIVASAGYRDLMARQAVHVGRQTSRSRHTAADTPSLPNSYANLDHWLSDQMGQLSSAYRDREQVKTWLRAQMVTLSSALAQPADLRKERLDAPMPAGSAIDFDGFLPLSVQFNPATYYRTYARVSGNYDGDYDGFRLDGKQSEAFAELLQFTQAKKIPIVFVNTPLTDEYLDDYRQQAEGEFLQYMLKLSSSQVGFLFRDLGQIWPRHYDYFSDPSHLNRYGAYQVSLHLAQDPLISWPVVSPSSPATP
ncbi:MAG: DUF1574 domain-containing protein [Cyanobacteria bacterium REEB459]|nr:DUF1574 domain-containing protein [Cyanobacteria bacterium REEB459]